MFELACLPRNVCCVAHGARMHLAVLLVMERGSQSATLNAKSSFARRH